MPDLDRCRATREGLTEYLEDALSSAGRQGTEEHLASCEACRHYVHRMRSTIDHLSQMPREPVPPEIRRRLLDAFRRARATSAEIGS